MNHHCPVALADLQAAIADLPRPPALEGLANLGVSLSGAGAFIPGDLLAALEGVLSPLQNLTLTLSISPAGRIACS